MNVIDYPKPIIIDGLPPLHRKSHTAGTKGMCAVCHQRKTYRYIGGKPVCSYCTDSEKAKHLGPTWNKSIIQREPDIMENEYATKP